MPIEQALRLSSIMLAAVSFVGLALGGGLPIWLAVLTGLALILALLKSSELKLADRVAAHVTLSATTWNILVLFGFLEFWIDSLWIAGELLSAGIHFLLILMVIKLFNLQFQRDYLHLYAISLVAMLAAASLTTDLWYLLIFLSYLVASVWTLLLFQLAKKSERVGISAAVLPSLQKSVEPSCRVTPQFFWMANGIAGGTLGLALVMFFAIPRVGAGFYQNGYGESLRTSGFSNTVDLGAIGPIKRDPSVVMRVELPDGSMTDGGRIYLRGVAFDRYDGKSWINQLSHRRVMKETTPGTFALHRSLPDEHPSLGPAFRQNILLEPLDTPVLFAAPFAETVSGKFTAVQADSMGAFYLPFSSSTRLEYSVISRSNPVLPADLQAHPVSYSEPFGRYFLQMPADSERIATLAYDITQAQQTAYEKAVAIQEHLVSTYQYSLDAPLMEQTHPLEEFLFNRKTGYCEHYATAMVIMLRAIGIPARLITGFLAEEWNEYGNYYVVRQQDAHAWVEVHLPYSGWVMMDPTPASGDSESHASSAWQVLGRIVDSIRLRWNRLFVHYSAADQLAVVREIQAGSDTAHNTARESLATFLDSLTAVLMRIAEQSNRNIPGLLGVCLLFVVLAGLSALIWLGMRWSGKLRVFLKGTYREESPIESLYGRMVQHLAKKGILKPAAMAPLEFMRMAQQQWSEAGLAVTAITELYCRGRFSQMIVTEKEYRSALDHLRQLMAMKRA